MVPTPNGFSKCRKCGTEQRSTQTAVKTSAVEKRDTIVIEKDESNLPIIEQDCPKCSNKSCYFWLIQTRSSDEPPTRFLRCTECKHTWREYS